MINFEERLEQLYWIFDSNRSIKGSENERIAFKEAVRTLQSSVIPTTQGAEDVLSERMRQIFNEGFDPAHDDTHNEFDLAEAANGYIQHVVKFAHHFQISESSYRAQFMPKSWPWHLSWWKPKDPRRDLVRAAALIIAEIDRLDRETQKQTAQSAKETK